MNVYQKEYPHTRRVKSLVLEAESFADEQFITGLLRWLADEREKQLILRAGEHLQCHTSPAVGTASMEKILMLEYVERQPWHEDDWWKSVSGGGDHGTEGSA